MEKLKQFFTWILDKAQQFNEWEAKNFPSREPDDDSESGYEFDSNNGPAVNIDGTPMMGSVDIHGNPFGVTSREDTHDRYWNNGPSTSMDGPSMGIGFSDIHGNSHGISNMGGTDNTFHSF